MVWASILKTSLLRVEDALRIGLPCKFCKLQNNSRVQDLAGVQGP